MRALGLLGGGDKPKWFIPNVTVMKPTTTSKLFKDFLKTYDNKEMADEASEVLTTAIDHKNLKPIFDKVWNNNTFKKWVVYEAATGNFKFSGNSNLNSSQDSIANEIMVFDLDKLTKNLKYYSFLIVIDQLCLFLNQLN